MNPYLFCLFLAVSLTLRIFLQSGQQFGYRVNPTGLSWATSPRASLWRRTRKNEKERHGQLTQTPWHGRRMQSVNRRTTTRRRKTDDKWPNGRSLSGQTVAPRPDPLRPNLDSERRVRTERTATGTFVSGWASLEQNKESMSGILFLSPARRLYFDVTHFPTEMRWSALELMNMKRAKNSFSLSESRV